MVPLVKVRKHKCLGRGRGGDVQEARNVRWLALSFRKGGGGGGGGCTYLRSVRDAVNYRNTVILLVKLGKSSRSSHSFSSASSLYSLWNDT